MAFLLKYEYQLCDTMHDPYLDCSILDCNILFPHFLNQFWINFIKIPSKKYISFIVKTPAFIFKMATYAFIKLQVENKMTIYNGGFTRAFNNKYLWRKCTIGLKIHCKHRGHFQRLNLTQFKLWEMIRLKWAHSNNSTQTQLVNDLSHCIKLIQNILIIEYHSLDWRFLVVEE